MSQQSTLKMMLPYFDRWMIKFPTLKDLALANEAEVLKLWEGLGYYSRARNLHKTAKILETEFPRTPSELCALPGIGPYTAAAIASIAFDHPSLALDGNVIRVLSRLFGIPDALNQKTDLDTVRIYAQKLAESFPETQRGNLTQSFMELGATVCLPGSRARCAECPLQKHCYALANGKVAQIPATKIRREMTKISRLLLIYRNARAEPLLRQIPVGQVLEGQWELPHLDLASSDEWIKTKLSQEFELKAAFKHTIMHRNYAVWPLELGRIKSLPAGHAFLGRVFAGTLSTVTRKYLGDSG